MPTITFENLNPYFFLFFLIYAHPLLSSDTKKKCCWNGFLSFGNFHFFSYHLLNRKRYSPGTNIGFFIIFFNFFLTFGFFLRRNRFLGEYPLLLSNYNYGGFD